MKEDVPIDATTTSYGCAAVDLLGAQADEIQDGDRLAQVTVVVPSNYVAVAARRALAARPGGIANVTFLTLRRLAERLGAPALAAAGRRPMSAPVIAAAMRAVLNEAPGVFAPVAEHPATEDALVSAHRELRTVPDTALDAVAACAARASDVVRIHRTVRDRLAGSWYDEEDLLATVAAALRCGAGADLGPVIVHLLPDLTSGESELLQVLAARNHLKVNIPLTGEADADAPVLAAYARAGITEPETETIEPPCATEILSATDPDDEVRAAVRLVTQWTHEGVRLGRIAVLYGNADPYTRLVHQQLTAAGIPVNGTPVRALGDMLLGRTLRALLALPDRDFRRQDVLGVLTNAPLLDRDEHIPSRAWERLSRKAGVVSGDDWPKRLALFVEQQRAGVEGEESELRIEQRHRDADRAEALAMIVDGLRQQLALGEQAQSWAALTGWAHGLIDTYLGDDRRRVRWPEEEQEAAHRVEEALDALAGLDALGGPPPTLEIFRRALDSELDTELRRVGRSGEAVLVGHVSIASGLVLDRLVMLGMAESRFPPRRLEDSLLSDAEREAAGGHLRLRAHRIHDDHRHLLAAIAAADEAVLCWPRGDLRRSTDQPASRWLLSDAARLAGIPDIRTGDLVHHADESWCDHITSYAGGLAQTPVHTSDQELRLAAVARAAPEHPVLLGDNRISTALEVVRARRSEYFTRFDGNLANVAAEIGRPEHTSATRLQTWATCPRSYFFGYLLGVEHPEEPERRYEIDPLERGTLVHQILEDFVREALGEGHTFDAWSAADRARLHQIAETHFNNAEQAGLTGRELFWRRDRTRIVDELDRFIDTDNERFAAGFRPVKAELRFDDVGAALPSGHVLHLRGSIDRIDRHGDGSLEVLDYKSGGSGKYKKLSKEEPHDKGRRLQLYVYGLAARTALAEGTSVSAYYWFLKDGKRHGYSITPEVEQKVASAIDQIVEGIAAGVFPAHPSEPVYGWVDCWHCTPDGLSDAHVRREWERKRLDPALADYVALCEPGTRDDVQ
ncbi:PD-(D/E)XK nuclease family protein [Mycolicibacterium austroafricanum]|uniref:PD-(D/E)XK nuclease family protein n=1 Tax=Mycolicibacterium austroafricanum TaxID=39687 RepID=UPI001CA36CF8|nr:PD-(D/E)XK nuclease family protein [Mycolicibacterium austroafricanum]QZT60293.1 PD-(D/E)XK nuclease family protein [Mycolicibacterium austroafricanum]